MLSYAQKSRHSPFYRLEGNTVSNAKVSLSAETTARNSENTLFLLHFEDELDLIGDGGFREHIKGAFGLYALKPGFHEGIVEKVPFLPVILDAHRVPLELSHDPLEQGGAFTNPKALIAIMSPETRASASAI